MSAETVSINSRKTWQIRALRTNDPSNNSKLPNDNETSQKQIQSQQNSQQHQYSAHYTGSGNGANPANDGVVRKPAEMSALDRLKNIQSNFKRTWNGIDCMISGRAGTSNFVNKKRIFSIPESYNDEEERQKNLAKVFVKLRDIEEDKVFLSNPQSSQTSFNKTVSSSANGVGGFFQSTNPSTTSSQFYNVGGVGIVTGQTIKKDNEFISFKNIKENQMISHSQPFTGYQKSYHIENSELLYKMLRFDNKLLRSVFEANGFSHTESHEWNILWSASSCKSYIYEGLNEYQKINHYPQSYEITRKDRLCYNMVRMQERFGKQNFDFIPDTYILPDEFGDFYAHYQKLKQHDSKKNIWIVKPANSSQGKGIYIVDDINDVNVDDTSVISRYVTNPLLINGHKFDLRIYVLVACYEPMRIYVFQEGLARFASETYTSKINKNNKFMHLTNYSINKKNENFIQNENSEQDDFGFKWSLGAFCKHLEQVGIDMNLLWSRINDVIIKTIICGEHHVTSAMKKNGTHRTNCFEVFGFDVLIDSDLKPWLLEVNLSPSLATDAPLDLTIKSTLVTDAFNLVGIRRFDRKKESLNKIKHRMKGYYKPGTGGSAKKSAFGNGIQGTSLQPSASSTQNELFHQPTSQQLYQLIDKYVQENPQEFGNMHDALRKAISLRQKDYIRETLQEYQKKGNYLRIFPAKNSDIYDCFFSGPRPFNRLIYKVLYTDEVMRCIQPKPSNDMKLNYKIDIPPGNYEQYKNKAQERVGSSQLVTYAKRGNGPEEREEMKSVNDQINETVQSVQSQGGNPSSKGQVSRQQLVSAKERPATGKTPMDNSMNNGGVQPLQQQSLNSSITQTTNTKSQSNQSQQIEQQQNQKATAQEKVLITGDDILIEYVERLMNCLKGFPDEQLNESWRVALDKFITHYVWHSQERRMEVEDPGKVYYTPYWFRLEGRLNEMQERRRRLIKYLFKKEGKLHEFEEGFKQSIGKKSTIIKKFTSIQLEDLLRTSTKNVAQEVVSSLIPQTGGVGVLADIEKMFQGGGSNLDRRKTTIVRQQKGIMDEDGGYDASGNEVDMSNRSNAGANLRQSKSANAARSLTRKNQQQLAPNSGTEEIFPMHSSAAKQQPNVLTSNQSANTSTSRPAIGKNPALGLNGGMSGTRAGAFGGGDSQNLTDMIQKREISNNYIKRILDNQQGIK